MKEKSVNIGRNVIANYLGQGWSALMAVVFLPAYISFLGYESYGIIGFFTVLQSTLSFLDFGVAAMLMREAANYSSGLRPKQSLRNLVRSAELICALSNILLTTAIWFLADRIANHWFNAHNLEIRSVSITIGMMGCLIALRLQENIYRGILIGLSRQGAVNFAVSLLTTARYAGAVLILYYFSPNIIAFFIWQIAISILSLVVFFFLCSNYLPVSDKPPHFSLVSITSVWQFSAGMSMVACLSSVVANIDRLIMSSLLSLDEFGKYSLVSTAAGILYLLVVPITQAFYPEMVGALVRGDNQRLINLHHFSSQLVAVMSGSLAVMYIVFSKQILNIWSENNEFVNSSSPLLVILSIAAFINCLGYVGQNLHVVYGSANLLAMSNAGVLIFTLLLLPTMIREYGLIGGAYSSIVIAFFQSIVLLVTVRRKNLNVVGFRWLMYDILFPLIGALISVCMLTRLILEYPVSRLSMLIYLFLIFCATLIISALMACDIRTRLVILFNSWRASC